MSIQRTVFLATPHDPGTAGDTPDSVPPDSVPPDSVPRDPVPRDPVVSI